MDVKYQIIESPQPGIDRFMVQYDKAFEDAGLHDLLAIRLFAMPGVSTCGTYTSNGEVFMLDNVLVHGFVACWAKPGSLTLDVVRTIVESVADQD